MISVAISPQIAFSVLFIGTLSLVLIVLVEISRNNRRREVGKMFASDKFEAKVSAAHLSQSEVELLERIVRQSSFSNKDSILNSPILFEEAVNDVYKLNHGAENVSPADCENIRSLRQKLGHLDFAQKYSYVSTRQFLSGMDVALSLPVQKDVRQIVHRKIQMIDERCWNVNLEDARLENDIVGDKISVRFTIPGEAVYSAQVRVLGVDGSGHLTLSHSTDIRKEQLRRWLRLSVNFPVRVRNGERSLDGFLVDLSAGGILLSLPEAVPENTLVHICFGLPGFGEESLDVRILRVLHRGEVDAKTGGIDHSASFIGDFGETQEHVLQYIFHERRNRERAGQGALTV